MKEGTGRNMCSKDPPYKHPDTGELLTYDDLDELMKEPMEKLFKVFFPRLDETNWESILEEKHWPLQEMPYQLKLENMTSYYEKCHYCNKD